MEDNQTDNSNQNSAKSNNTQPQNGLAIAALVCGIISLALFWMPFGGLALSIVAIILGIISMKKSSNKVVSIVSIVAGSIALLWNLFVTFAVIVAMIGLGSIVVNGDIALSEINKATDNYSKTQQDLIDSKKDFSKGSTAIFGNFEVKVNSVVRNYVPEDEYYTASDGKEFIVVNVSVKNIGDSSASFSSYDLDINVNGISNGTSYVTVAPEFTGGDMSKNATASGNLVYEVEKDVTNLKLQYEEGAIDLNTSSYKELTFTLEI